MKKLLLLITALFILASAEGQILRYSNYTAPTPPAGPEEPLDADFEVDRYISGLSTPLHDSVESKLRVFVIALKDSLNIDSLAQAFDVMQILANGNSEAALKNLVKRDHDCTPVNSPTFTAFEGYTFDGSTNYIDLDYIPDEDYVTISTTTHSMGVYCRIAPSTTSSSDNNGVYDTGVGTGSRFSVNAARSSEIGRGYACNTSTAAQATFTNGIGMFTISRTASDVVYAYGNTTVGTIDKFAAQGLPGYTMYVGACNTDGVAGEHQSGQFSLVFIGRGFTSDEVADILTCFEAYMDSNGKGILE